MDDPNAENGVSVFPDSMGPCDTPKVGCVTPKVIFCTGMPKAGCGSFLKESLLLGVNDKPLLLVAKLLCPVLRCTNAPGVAVNKGLPGCKVDGLSVVTLLNTVYK